jgi:S1-C subfamily serine protease
MAAVDWIALAVVALAALGGWRRGFVASVLSLAGLLAGAYAGSRIGQQLFADGAHSRWTPVASLVGALAGAALLQTVAALAGSVFRTTVKLTPFRVLDSLGGIVFGAIAGLALVWVAAATVLLLPGQTRLRTEVQRSELISRLNERVPPRRLLHLLARIDPIQSIVGPPAPEAPPTSAIARDADVQRAARSVVRIVGTACGVGVEGSGFFIGPTTVATAAHVVAGEDDTHVELPGVGVSFAADVVAFDRTNDVAILRVRGAAPQRALGLRASPEQGRAVAIVGYPLNGPLSATPGRIGATRTVVSRDALGHGPVTRSITAVGGRVQHGNSGGPAIDSDGAVQSLIFAARVDGAVGYGVPPELVARAARDAQGPVSTGACAAG